MRKKERGAQLSREKERKQRNTLESDPTAVDRCKQQYLNSCFSPLDLEAVKRQIEGGANVNLPDIYNLAPLDYAIETTSLELVTLLLEAGADPYHKSDGNRNPIQRCELYECYHHLLPAFEPYLKEQT